MEDRIKLITAIGIPYVFLCAGLYQISFWSTFDINILSFLDVADIIKSFIDPFFFSALFTVGLCSILYYSLSYILPPTNINIDLWNAKQKVMTVVIFTVYLGYFLYLITFSTSIEKGISISYMLFSAFLILFVQLSFKISLTKPNRNHLTIILVIVLFPHIAYVKAKYRAIDIYDNKHYQYTEDVLPDKQLKFLGKASSHYIFVSLDNKETYYFDVSEVKGLRLLEKPFNPN